MNKLRVQRFTDINIEAEIERRIGEIEDELQELVFSGQGINGLTGYMVFMLEALGYTVDIHTGAVERNNDDEYFYVADAGAFVIKEAKYA